jgi:hypothetical protein
MRAVAVGVAGLVAVGMFALVGCSAHQSGPLSEAVNAESSADTETPTPSKGTGLKKRKPVNVHDNTRLAWVENAVNTYPTDQFYTGVGMAPDRGRAEARALVELQKPFVRALSNWSVKAPNLHRSWPESKARDWQLQVERCRKRTLAWIADQGRVTDVFIERKPVTTYYALAVLDRSVLMQGLYEKRAQRDRRVKEIVGRQDRSDRSLAPQEAASLIHAYACGQALDISLAVAGGHKRDISPPVSPQTLDRLMQNKN